MQCTGNTDMSAHKDEQRIVWLDIARVLAIVSISSNHAVNRAFRNFGTLNEAYMIVPYSVTIFRAIISVFSRLGVPLFLMITGALCLKKEFEKPETVKTFYLHNLLGIFITSELWYFIMFWYRTLLRSNTILEKGFVYAIKRCIGTMLFIDQETMGSMWYIPMILCVYTVIPLLGISVQKLDRIALLVPMICVTFASMIIPNISRAIDVIFNKDISFAISSENIFSMFSVFVIVGYFVNQKIFSTLHELILIIASIGLFALCVFYQIWEYSLIEGEHMGYDFFPLGVLAIILFEIIRRKFESKRENVIISYISKISFAIYFVHVIIVSGLAGLSFGRTWSPILLFFFYEVASFVGSIVVVKVLGKNQIIRERLFLIK